MAGDKKTRRDDAAGKNTKPSSKPKRSMDSEQTARIMLIGGVSLIIVLALGFIAFGWYWTEKRPLGRTVLQVDEETVSFAAMKRRMNYELFRNTTLQQNPSVLASFAFENLVAELTKVSRADEIGVTVDEAALDTAMRTRIGVAPEADQRTYQDALRNQLQSTGLHESEFRRLVEGETIETAIVDKFQAELPATLLQAKVEVINVQTREEADAAILRINAGEDFAVVAKEISLEPTAKENGGLKDFAPEGSLNVAYNDFAFSAEVGMLSVPLAAAGDTSFYVVRVIDRSDQPLAEDEKPTLARAKYDEWLTTIRTEMESSGALVNKFDNDDQTEAILAVLEDATPRLVDQAEQQAQQSILQQTAIAELTQNPQPTAAPATPTDGSTPSADGSVSTPSSQPVAPSVP